MRAARLLRRERLRALESAGRRAVRFARAARGHRAAGRAIAAATPVAHAAPTAYTALLLRLGRDCVSVLDVGTGLMDSLALLSPRVKIGVDAHRPYLEHRRLRGAVPLHADALAIDQLFVPGAVDLVTMIDVIEHFPEAEARALLLKAEIVAARRVVVTTPRGRFPQGPHDAFGLGGEEYQRHRSEWEVEALVELGYRVIVVAGFHDRRNESFVRAFPPGAPPVDALVAWKDTGARGHHARAS